ncbi:MAG: hypothetical protein M1830_005752, partial [Pleopsidium flavum]
QTAATAAPRRAPLGTPTRPAPNTPFSHIQIIPKVSPEGLVNNSPQPTFRKPSYQQEAEITMSAANNPQGSSAHLSLASNATSGTTFAAKARAAELNAAKARRASKDLEEGEVPSPAPVSLAAMTKFAKARNKGKAWKRFNLNVGYEGVGEGRSESLGGLDEAETSSDYEDHGKGKIEEIHRVPAVLRDIVNIKNPHRLRQQLAADAIIGTSQGTEFSPESRALSRTDIHFDIDEWDPNLPPGPANEGSISTISSPARHQEPATTTTQIPQERTLSADIILPPGQEAKLASLGVLPPVSRDPNKHNIPSVGPRAEVSFTNQQMGNNVHITDSQRFGAAYQFDANSSQRFHEPMNFDFRFPPQQGLYQFNHYQQLNPYEQVGYFTSNPQAQMASYPQAGHPYQSAHVVAPAANVEGNSEYQPSYGSAPMTNKRDILLKSLHDVVESSRARESSRTVLYDPVAQSEASQTQTTEAEHAVESSKSEHEVLENSEPLPGWKTRPVDIHDVVTPVMTNAELAALSKLPTYDISPSNSNNGIKPRARFPTGSMVQSSGRLSMIQEAEEWWKADHRGEGELRAYLNRVADDDKIKKQLKAEERTPRSEQQQVGTTDSWSDVSSKTVVNAYSSGGDVANRLLTEVLANFHGYLAGPPETQRGQFGSFGTVPEWCIDKGLGGSTSFFGEDWGAPPPRVGRDPRYRPMLHEPRYTLYEELERRGSGGDIYGRRFR